MVPFEIEKLKGAYTRNCTKKMESHTFVASATPPFTIAYRLGSRYLGSSSASKELVALENSEHLTTTAFPAAIAPDWVRIRKAYFRIKGDLNH